MAITRDFRRWKNESPAMARVLKEEEVLQCGNMEIRRNSSNELFIKDTESGVEMRLSSNHHHRGSGLQFTSWGAVPGRVEPIRVANDIGWAVVPR